jgi:phosphoglycerate dehydrogenase-like enzyme
MRVAIIDDYCDVALEAAPWRTALPPGTDLVVFNDHVADEDELVERLADFDIVCVMRERTAFPARVLERLPRLRLIASTGYHNASIDLDAARRRGILVSGTPTISSATPEHVMALVLALARQLRPTIESMNAGGWQCAVGRTLAGATMGILGLGNVGSRVARLAAAFGMEVVAWSQNLTPEVAAARGARYLPADEFFATADFVSIHLKLSARTRHIVDAEQFELMKPDSYLVNTARAENVNLQALLHALRTDQIAGAALDVFETEPLPPDDPLRHEPKLLLTPHIGFVTHTTMRNFHGEALQAVVAFLRGRRPELVLT